MPSASSTKRVRTDSSAYYLANREYKLAYAKKYREANKEKVRAANKKWKEENPEKTREYIRASMAKTRYGVTRTHYKAMMDAQGGCCAICGIHQSKLKRRFCIDHDHETKVVRGLVCHPCNIVLGHARDNVEVLRAAITYLQKHQK